MTQGKGFASPRRPPGLIARPRPPVPGFGVVPEALIACEALGRLRLWASRERQRALCDRASTAEEP